RSDVGKARQVDAVPQRLHARGIDALFDHVAGAVVRDADELMGEARCQAHDEKLAPSELRESAVMVRVNAARHSRPPRRGHAVDQRTIVVRVDDVEAFLAKHSLEPPPQSGAETRRRLQRYDANAGSFERVGKIAARTKDDYRPVKARLVPMPGHLDKKAFLSAHVQPKRNMGDAQDRSRAGTRHGVTTRVDTERSRHSAARWAIRSRVNCRKASRSGTAGRA